MARPETKPSFPLDLANGEGAASSGHVPYTKSINTPFGNPMLFDWRSNAIECDRKALGLLSDGMEGDDATLNSCFYDACVPLSSSASKWASGHRPCVEPSTFRTRCYRAPEEKCWHVAFLKEVRRTTHRSGFAG